MIKLANVSKIFNTRKGESVVALKDVSLQFEEKEFVTIVGPSGCGKSTLLKLIAGLIQVDQGTIHVREKLVTEPFPDIGFVFQNPVLLPWRNVIENVLFSIEMLGQNVKDYKQKALDLIHFAGLPGFETKYPSELSGGMQQRVAICRALVHDPSLLLMDEPFGALDAMTREEMAYELLRIWEQQHKTILFVTHSISEAILLADYVVILTQRPGRVACVLEINLRRPRHRDVKFTVQFKSYVEKVEQLMFKKET